MNLKYIHQNVCPNKLIDYYCMQVTNKNVRLLHYQDSF